MVLKEAVDNPHPKSSSLNHRNLRKNKAEARRGGKKIDYLDSGVYCWTLVGLGFLGV